MSEPTKPGWTLETLKALMDERDRRYAEVGDAREKAITAALVAAEKALTIAEANSEKWRNNANEWRASMLDRERNFLNKGIGYIVGGMTIVALAITIFGVISQ